jgi:hypothetical protein
MQQFDGSETNPYAPPETEGAASGRDEKPLVKRPASVRWATVVMGGAFLVGGWNYLHSIHEFGLDALFPADLRSTAGLAFVLLAGPALFRLALRSPRVSTYWLGAIALGLFCLFRALEFHHALMSRNDFLMVLPRSSYWMVVGIAAAINLGLVWLFIRFAFGRPCRRFFRILSP